MSNQAVENKETAKNDSGLPDFMSENGKASYQEEGEKTTWLSSNLHRTMIGISIAWFAIVFIYISQYFGWSNLFLMMPDEFGGFLAGISLPLAIIWVVMAYIDRETSFKHEAKFLRAYMNQLVYPEEGAANTAKAMADGIRSQVIELREVTKYATEQTEKIKVELGNRVDDFAKLVKTLDNYSSKTIVELTDGVKTLVQSFDYVADKAETATDNFRGYINELNGTAGELEGSFNTMFGKLLPHIQEMKSSSALLQDIAEDNTQKMSKANETVVEFTEKANKSMSYVSDMLNTQSSRLEKISLQTIENCDNMTKNLNHSIDRLDDVLRSQGQLVLNHIDNLDKRADGFMKKFDEHNDMIEVEVEKVLARANVIEESVSVQVNELSGVADNILDNMKTVEEGIKIQVAGLERATDEAIVNIHNVVETVEKETAKLQEIADNSVVKTTEVADDISAKTVNIQKLSDNVLANLRNIAQELGERVETVKAETEESVTRFTEIGNVMKKQADSLIEASSIVVSQSKVSETSLAQQQRHISGSITRIEEIKGELKRQVDELSRTAGQIEEEAASSVDKLKQQLEATVTTCDSVVSRTKALNDNLNEQSARFDSATSKTLSKAQQFDDILNSQYQKWDNTSTAIQERADKIAGVLSKSAASIEGVTVENQKTFNELQTAFETQSQLLNSVAENTVGYVSDVVQALDEKAGAINILFKHQENEFFDICDRISENTGNIGNSLKKQVAVIEQSADKIFARMALLEEDVNKRAENVVETSTKSIEKLAEVDKAIAVQNEEVSKFMQDITANLNNISATFKANVNDFGKVMLEAKDEASAITENLLSGCGKINEAQQNLAVEGKNISGLLDGHVKNMDMALTKTQSQAETIRDTFEQQKESLTDIVNVVATQTRLGEASLAQQYKTLSDLSAEVAQKMNEINGKFKDTTDTAVDNSAKIAYEIDVLADRLLKVGDDIAKTAKNSVKNIEQVNMSLGQTAEDLGHSVTQSVANVGNVMKDYEKYIASFNTVTAEASTGVIEINNLISEQSDKMITISEDTKKLVECFNTVLNDTSLELSHRANQAFDKVKGLGDNLKNLSLQIDETAKMSSTHLDNAGSKMRASIAEIASNAERVANDIRTSGEVFLKQSDVLVLATEDTVKKVGDVMNSLKNSAADFSNQGDNLIQKSVSFNDIVSKQLKSLLEVSEKADKKLTDMEKRYKNLKVENFLKDASYIIEKLETVSVDINRVFNPNAEEELWKKYYNGDSAAFVRYLAKSMTKQQIVAVRKEYEENLEFRNLVNRYLGEFETLIEKARVNERSGILLSVISGADIGKLYYILAKALDKLN